MKKVGANDGCVVGPISDLRAAGKEDQKNKNADQKDTSEKEENPK